MTINVQIPTIMTSIAQISIAGVTVTDADNIPECALDYCPILFPVTDRLITNMSFVAQSLGPGSTRNMEIEYPLNYRLCYAPLGSGSFGANNAGVVATLKRVTEAILLNQPLTGAIIMRLDNAATGTVTDPAGTIKYHGAEFTLRLTEYPQ